MFYYFAYEKTVGERWTMNDEGILSIFVFVVILMDNNKKVPICEYAICSLIYAWLHELKTI